MDRVLNFNYLPVNIEVEIRKDEDGFFVVSCPSLKGCHSQGLTIKEALDNIADAILGCMYADEKEIPEIKLKYLMRETSHLSISEGVVASEFPVGSTSADIREIQYPPFARVVAL